MFCQSQIQPDFNDIVRTYNPPRQRLALYNGQHVHVVPDGVRCTGVRGSTVVAWQPAKHLKTHWHISQSMTAGCIDIIYIALI